MYTHTHTHTHTQALPPKQSLWIGLWGAAGLFELTLFGCGGELGARGMGTGAGRAGRGVGGGRGEAGREAGRHIRVDRHSQRQKKMRRMSLEHTKGRHVLDIVSY